jgi:hypothetical protein
MPSSAADEGAGAAGNGALMEAWSDMMEVVVASHIIERC